MPRMFDEVVAALERVCQGRTQQRLVVNVDIPVLLVVEKILQAFVEEDIIEVMKVRFPNVLLMGLRSRRWMLPWSSSPKHATEGFDGPVPQRLGEAIIRGRIQQRSAVSADIPVPQISVKLAPQERVQQRAVAHGVDVPAPKHRRCGAGCSWKTRAVDGLSITLSTYTGSSFLENVRNRWRMLPWSSSPKCLSSMFQRHRCLTS